MADKKKKQNSKKQTDKKTKFVRAEDIKNPKLPKKNKIPKGVDHTLISNEGNIIMTYTFGDISDKKQKTAKRTTAAKKSSKQAKSKTKPAAKSAAKKPTAKAAPKRAVKAAKPSKSKTVPKKTETKKTTSKKAINSKIKALKPDRNFENGTDGESKIIILNGKKKADKQTHRGRKKLKRVANIGGYTAWDGRTGKTFATEKEARDYAVDVFIRTGELIPVTHTQRTVSHTFKAENKTEN